jgi:hypothetical protein
MGAHETPDAVLDQILMDAVQARARRAAALVTGWLNAPAREQTPLDVTPADVVEVLRELRDIADLVTGVLR